MTLTRMFGLVSVVSVFAIGCSAGSDAPPSVTLSGNVGGSSAAKSWGAVDTHGTLHVSAHELHKNGAHGRNVDVVVGADGYWSVAVTRGARWVVTVDGADGSSAMITFGNKKNVIEVSGAGGDAHVDFGKLHIAGGEATTDVTIGDFGLAATLAEADEIFEDAKGQIIEAEKAIADAEQAAANAEKQANDAAAQAEQAAADAKKNAGL